MDPMQMFREFMQNGSEASANRVVVDGFSAGNRVSPGSPTTAAG
jgi:hypothetical protein